MSNMEEKVKAISVRTFTISSCPETVYQRFIKFCNDNAKNTRFYKDENNKVHQKDEIIYHIGLRLLLDVYEADAKSLMLFEKIKALELDVENIRLKLSDYKPKLKSRTFGGKNGKEE